MNPLIVFCILIGSAILEAGGDALVRAGLTSSALGTRILFFLLGALTLFAYGFVLNSPRWDFGKLIGIYVAGFFIVAQVISYFGFHERPTTSILIGGALIVSGGLVITLMK
jgi:small multidrug resistance family-3 protein